MITKKEAHKKSIEAKKNRDIKQYEYTIKLIESSILSDTEVGNFNTYMYDYKNKWYKEIKNYYKKLGFKVKRNLLCGYIKISW